MQKNDGDQSGFLEAPFVRMLRMRSASLKKLKTYAFPMGVRLIIMSEFLKNSNAICKIPEASEFFKYSSRIRNESMAEGIPTKKADGSSYLLDE